MKLCLYITDLEGYLNGNVDSTTFNLGIDQSMDGYVSHYSGRWVFLKEIEIEDHLIDRDKLRSFLMADFEAEEKQARAELQIKIEKINERRQKLLAIEHKPAQEGE